jgi:rhodanese-related sulfurtransferase
MAVDWKEVENLKGFFSFFTSQYLSKRPCRVKPHTLVEWIKRGEKVTLVDIRTPEEKALIGFTYKNTLDIPMNRIFERENIEKLASLSDHKIVVACRVGLRSLVVTAFLRRVGLGNVYSLEGGIVAFAQEVKC